MATPARLLQTTPCLLLILACGPDLSAQTLTVRAEEYLAAQQEVNHFMGSVLIAREGQPLFRKSIGLANVEHDVPNKPQTKFRLGSNSKQFTAAAVLLLQERGLLDVQDPIGKYLKNAPPAWAEVRIHHLLNHSSGIPSFTSFPDYKKTWMIPSRPEETMGRFRDKPLKFTPGQKVSYSNSGYILLAVIIERVSQMRYEEFLRKNIFEPLAMKESGHDTFSAILSHRATGYTWGAAGLEHAPYHDMDLPIGAGSLYSTVDDLLKWDQALYTDSLLSAESRAAMFSPFQEVSGYGWGIAELAGRKTQAHSGRINGFVAQIIRFPAEKVTVVVLANVDSRSFRKIGPDLAAILFGDNYELPPRKK